MINVEEWLVPSEVLFHVAGTCHYPTNPGYNFSITGALDQGVNFFDSAKKTPHSILFPSANFQILVSKELIYVQRSRIEIEKALMNS